ncbi:N/A [soil metagenome]
MKMKGAKAVHYESGPNMTPLVDVVMVILIFLMLAGQFGGAEHYLASNMPLVKGGSGGEPGNAVSIDEPVEIRVDSPSPDRFIARGSTINATDSATLFTQLESLRKRMNAAGKKTSEISVKIAPGRGVMFQHVVAVQEAAMKASFEKIGFASSH